MKTYTHIDIGDGDVIIQCDDCGAHTTTGYAEFIIHYKGCKPTPEHYFNEDEEDEMGN